jgi:hypothetical protein
MNRVDSSVCRNAQAETICRQVLPVITSVGRSTPKRIQVPGSAAQAASWLPMTARHPRATILGGSDVVVVPNIGTPLPDVTDDVMKSPGVRPLPADRLGTVPGTPYLTVPGTPYLIFRSQVWCPRNYPPSPQAPATPQAFGVYAVGGVVSTAELTYPEANQNGWKRRDQL